MPDLFEPGKPILVARAPGRLDVMGGIGDYSGSLVLEMPIAEAAFAAVQAVDEPGVTVVSLPQQPGEAARRVYVSRRRMGSDCCGRTTTRPAASCTRIRDTAWTAYVLGPVLVLTARDAGAAAAAACGS